MTHRPSHRRCKWFDINLNRVVETSHFLFSVGEKGVSPVSPTFLCLKLIANRWRSALSGAVESDWSLPVSTENDDVTNCVTFWHMLFCCCCHRRSLVYRLNVVVVYEPKHTELTREAVDCLNVNILQTFIGHESRMRSYVLSLFSISLVVMKVPATWKKGSRANQSRIRSYVCLGTFNTSRN